jgi:Ras-related protein Rab-1A
VYDVTNAATFANVPPWLEEIKRYACADVNKLLVGNKSDMADKRAVMTSQGEELAQSLGIPFLETSAKTAANVEQTFITMAAEIKKRVAATQTQAPNANVIRPGAGAPIEEAGCGC